MEPMTISVIQLQYNKVKARLITAVSTDGKPGRSGRPLDNTALIAKLKRQLEDWREILEFANGR